MSRLVLRSLRRVSPVVAEEHELARARGGKMGPRGGKMGEGLYGCEATPPGEAATPSATVSCTLAAASRVVAGRSGASADASAQLQPQPVGQQLPGFTIHCAMHRQWPTWPQALQYQASPLTHNWQMAHMGRCTRWRCDSPPPVLKAPRVAQLAAGRTPQELPWLTEPPANQKSP